MRVEMVAVVGNWVVAGAVFVGDSAVMGPVPMEMVVVVGRRIGMSLVRESERVVAAEVVVVVDWLVVAVVPVEMEDWVLVAAAAVSVGLVVGSTVVVGAMPMEMLLVVVD